MCPCLVVISKSTSINLGHYKSTSIVYLVYNLDVYQLIVHLVWFEEYRPIFCFGRPKSEMLELCSGLPTRRISHANPCSNVAHGKAEPCAWSFMCLRRPRVWRSVVSPNFEF